MNTEDQLHIAALSMRAAYGLEEVNVEIGDAGVINIVGVNGAGKSSFIDAIKRLTGGAKAVGRQLLKDGHKSGEIVGRLEGEDGTPGIIVRVKIGKNGKGTLTIKGADDEKLTDQALLDAWTQLAGTEPLKLAELKGAARTKYALELAGVDFTELDAKRAEVYSARTGINGAKRGAESRLEAQGRFPDAPDGKVQTRMLQAERECLVERNADRRCLRIETVGIREKADEIAQLRKDLHAAEQALTTDREQLQKWIEDHPEAAKPVESTDPIDAQIREASDVNAQVDANATHAKLSAEVDQHQADSDAKTKQIAEIDEKKAQMLTDVQWAAPGFEAKVIDGEPVFTYLGRPLESASGSEATTLGVAIQCSLKRRLMFMLVDEASAALDAETMEIVKAVAQERQCPLFISRLSRDGAEGLVIELMDGEEAVTWVCATCGHSQKTPASADAPTCNECRQVMRHGEAADEDGRVKGEVE